MIEHSTFDEKILYLKSRAERIKNPRYRIFEDALRYPQRKISEIIHKHLRILLIDFQTLCKCHFCLSVFAVQKRSKVHLKLNYFSYSINHLSFQFLIFFFSLLSKVTFFGSWNAVQYHIWCSSIFMQTFFWWGCSLFTQVEHYKKLKANYGPANVFWSFL